MIKRFFLKKESSVASAAIVVAAFGLVSRILGLLRDRFLAQHFGAGDSLDVYFAAFKIPDFIYNVFILGAISAVLIPIFLDLNQKDQKESFRFLNLVLNDFIWVSLFFIILFIIFTPQLMLLISPGFDAEKMTATVLLTRIMLFSPLLLGVSNILSSILQAQKRFLTYALSPVFYNLGIIFGIFFFVPSMGIQGLAFGVLLGACLHFLIQLPTIIFTGFVFRPTTSFSDESLKKASRLMVPRSMAVISSQINAVVIVAIASYLASGSIAIINLANNLQSVAIGLFGIPLAIAVFPVLSSFFSRSNMEEFSDNFTKTLNKILFLAVPASFVFILLRAQIVRLVLGSGQFNWSDTKLTAATLGLFSLSILFQSVAPLFLRGFYAIQNTKTPFFINVASNVFNIICAISFIFLLRADWATGMFRAILKLEGISDISVLSLPLSFSLASMMNVGLLYYFFRPHIGEEHRKKSFSYLYNTVFISGVTCFIMFWSLRIPVSVIELNTFIGVLVQTVFSLIIGAVVYLFLSCKMGVSEAQELVKSLASLNKNFFSRASIEESIPREEH